MSDVVGSAFRKFKYNASDIEVDVAGFNNALNSGDINVQLALDTIDDNGIGGSITGSGAAGRVAFWESTSGLSSDSNLLWDSSNDRLGIQVASPLVPLHAASVTGTTLGNVVTGAISLISETLPTAPTGSITQIAMPSSGSGGSGISFTNGGSGTALTAYGTAYYARVYPCLVAGAYYYKSDNYEEFGPSTDPNDSQGYDFQVSGGSVSISGETVYYYVEYSTDGSTFYPLGVVSSSSNDFTTLSGSDTSTPWPSYYLNTPGTPAGSPASLSQSVTNEGMGTFNGGAGSNGTTWYYEIDSYVTIGGTKYVSGTPSTSSLTDNNNSQSYDWSLSYTPGSPAEGHILRRSSDGVTWEYTYLDASGSYLDTGFTNDTDAESRWGQTYSAGAVSYDFAPYGKTTSPAGSTVYSAAGTTYTTSIAADSIRYILKHTFTGMPAGNAKIVAPQSSPAYGLNVSGAIYDTGYTSWGDGATVTPSSYGFSGTSQNRDYKIYSSGSGIYGATPLVLSVTSGSGSKYVSGSFSYPAGITTVKILRQINGGGYIVSKTITSPTTTFTDDSTDGSWNGNTTVTPTSIVGGTARFDKPLTTLTNEAQLAIVETTGSGTRYSKISFGVAADSASAPSYVAHIHSTSGDGYLHMTTGRLEIAGSLGGTATVMLGNANIFNNASSSSTHFQVKSQNDASLINTRSDQDTVGFGQALGTDELTTVQIQPARSTDTALVLKGHASQTSTSEAMRVMTSGGSYVANITLGGNFQAVQGSASVPGFNFRADTDTGMYGATTNTIGFATGGTQRETINSTGHFFGGTTTPTARVHIAAGTTSASTAPIKLVSGSLMTTPEVGAIEFLTDKLYYTRTTSTTRMQVVAATASFTSTRIPYADSSGFLQDVASLTYSAGTGLTVTDHILMKSGVSASEFRFYEPSGSGTNYTAFKAQAQSGNITYTLPAADGSSGQVLSTNGSGALTWATAGGGTPAGSDTYVQFNDGGAFGGDAGLTYNKTTDVLSVIGGLSIGDNTATDRTITFNLVPTYGSDPTIKALATTNTIEIKAPGINNAGSLFQPIVTITPSYSGSAAWLQMMSGSGGSLCTFRAGADNGVIAFFGGRVGTSAGCGLSFYGTILIPITIPSSDTSGASVANGTIDLGYTSAKMGAIWMAKELNIGSDLGGKLNIDGSADEVQLWVQGHSTQTSNIVLVEKSDGTDLLTINNTGDIKLLLAGGGLYIKEGTNATMGAATLVAGTVTVSTTKVTANSRIMLTTQSLGTVAVPKEVAVTARTAGTSFTITSADNTDTSVVAWAIIEPS